MCRQAARAAAAEPELPPQQHDSPPPKQPRSFFTPRLLSHKEQKRFFVGYFLLGSAATYWRGFYAVAAMCLAVGLLWLLVV